jgi:ornithine cyclodeaminase/alanine dehydrogenase-like protein (mu-crystallin family)
MPIKEGRIGEDHVVADLDELLKGKRVRRGPEDVTPFESGGIVYENLVVE